MSPAAGSPEEADRKRACLFPWRHLWPWFFALALTGCVHYQPVPLTPQAAQRALAAPGVEEVRLRVAAIHHPLLAPVRFDLSDGLSPDEAALLAVANNPALRAARDRKLVAAAQVLEAGILPNPQLSAGLSVPWAGGERTTMTGYGLGLSWPVTRLLVHGAMKRTAEATARSVDLSVAWLEWQAAEAAKLHLYGLAVALHGRALAKQAEDLAKKRYKTVARGVDIGERTADDLSAARAGWRQAHTTLLRAQAAVDQERAALRQVLGPIPARVLKLQPGISVPYFAGVLPLETLTDGLEQRRLDLLALRSGYESQQARLRAAIRAQFPRININAPFERDVEGIDGMGAGFTIDLPLFDRGQGRIAIAKATRKQLFDEYTARLYQARGEIAALVQELNAIRKQRAAVAGALPALKRLAANYRKATGQGHIPVTSYYQARERIYVQRLEETALAQRAAKTGVALEIASGRYSVVHRDEQRRGRNEIR